MNRSQRDGFDDAQTVLAPRLGRPAAAAVEPSSFRLVVVDGPDKGKSLSIDGAQPSRVLVGQSPACELRLTDRQVSRRHAAFEPVKGMLRVTDLGSTNGTLVSGVAVVDAYLRGGEMIRIGETTLRVDLAHDVTSAPLPAYTSFGRLVGASAEMRRLYPLCERLAASAVPVIIEGETGTGKEVLAESIHEMGPRASGPFVVFDCTAVPPSLVESALFGHERGAFTGAVETRKGVFEEAHGGTLLIDEIGDLDIALQAKLLRALERSEVRRVGGSKWIRVDVRVLAATRRDLDQEIVAERFRDDLFFRLAVARIELPPLRRRTGDVAVLARHFWRHLAGAGVPFPEGFAERLEAYSWPGNVRELHNAVARRVALGELAHVEPTRQGAWAGGAAEGPAPMSSRASSLPSGGGSDFIEETLGLDLPLATARQKVIEEFERRYVQRVLAQHGGNVTSAAAASGIARRYFQLLRARRAT